MELKLDERSFSGKTFRPRPEIHVDVQSRLAIVATPWGPRAAAKKAIDRMTEYLALAREDREVTSPFERLSCLSGPANNLRIAAMLANEVLYREENADEYNCGVELFACVIDEGEMVWVQAGNPHILLARPGRALLPLGSQVDLAFDLSEGDSMLPALPSQLLGLDSTLNLNINSFRTRPGDRVLLLSHSHLPEILFTMKEADASLDSISLAVAKTHPEIAFWIGILGLGEAQEEAA